MSYEKNNIIDLDLSVTNRKKFRINGDDSKILELNTSDMSIIARVTDFYPKLNELQEKASKLMSGVSADDIESDNLDASFEALGTVSSRLKEIDTEMRNLLDGIFDAPVSEICAPDGSMYDPFNGSFRFEYIMNLLISQYENNLQNEFSKMEKQLEKHTSKYTKGR